MTLNDSVRRYIDAGQNLTQITRKRAEELVRDLVKNGEIERSRAQDWVEDLVRRSRETSEALVKAVADEVHRQLLEAGITNIEELAKRVAELLGELPEAARNAARTGRSATSRVRPGAKKEQKAPAKQAPSARAATGKANASGPGKSGPGKQAPRKAPAAKKSAVAKSTSSKAPANKSVGATKVAAAKTPGPGRGTEPGGGSQG